jgi:hypothetical protein
MTWPFSARTVIEDNRAASAVDEAEARYPRFSDLYEGIKWRLARKPEESGEPVPDFEGYYTLKTPNWIIEGVPVVQVLYKVRNKNEVTIVDFRVVE